MNTNFLNSNGSIAMYGNNINNIYFYNNGVVLGYVNELQEHEIKNDKLSSVYDGTPEEIVIDFEIKKALKLNLNRKDAFYIKNSEARYSFEKPYNLYINSDLVNFELLGDVLAVEMKHEKNYLEAYKITFTSASFKRLAIEKIILGDNENYKLLPGEQFHHTCYGPDKTHACVGFFDNSKNSFIAKRHPEQASDKGIIKRWFEHETLNNYSFIVTRPIYSKMIKDNYLTEIEDLSKKLKDLGINLSRYDIEKMNEAGVKITFEK